MIEFVEYNHWFTGAFTEFERVCREVCANGSGGMSGPDGNVREIVTAPSSGNILDSLQSLPKSSVAGKQNNPAK
jgi:hypothetical protein